MKHESGRVKKISVLRQRDRGACISTRLTSSLAESTDITRTFRQTLGTVFWYYDALKDTKGVTAPGWRTPPGCWGRTTGAS